MTIQTDTPRDRRTAGKVVASVAILAAAAAVAGLGTFGTFTDSTTPISTEIGTGTVSIDISTPQGVSSPEAVSGLVPGDSISRTVDLTNDGTSPLAEVRLTVAAGAPGPLTTDTARGLRLAVRSCTVPWTQGGTAIAPTYTCDGGTHPLYAGPVVMDEPLPGVASLDPSQVDHLLLVISLPPSAGNDMQNQATTLTTTFTGTQRAGAAR